MSEVSDKMRDAGVGDRIDGVWLQRQYHHFRVNHDGDLEIFTGLVVPDPTPHTDDNYDHPGPNSGHDNDDATSSPPAGAAWRSERAMRGRFASLPHHDDRIGREPGRF